MRSLEEALDPHGLFFPASRHLLAGFAPASTDKAPRLGRPAAQAAHLDGFGAAMEEAATAGQEPYAGSRLGAEAAPAHDEK